MSWLGARCVNCGARFNARQVRELMRHPRLGVQMTARYRLGVSLRYTGRARSGLRCEACLMEQHLPERQMVWIEVGYWALGSVLSLAALVALFSSLPEVPPRTASFEDFISTERERERSEFTLQLIWRLAVSVPMVIGLFWGLRRFVGMAARLRAVRPEGGGGDVYGTSNARGDLR